MPDARGRFKGISLSGISNPYLDSLERKPYEPITVPRAQLDAIEAALERDRLTDMAMGRAHFLPKR